MDLLVGLNPYGLTYTLGMQGAGTPRMNPAGPGGWRRFLEIAGEIGTRSVELDYRWLRDSSDAEMDALREQLAALGAVPVLSCPLPITASVPGGVLLARAIGASTIRCALTTVLCGDRARLGASWQERVRQARADLREVAPIAADAGITLAIENHQDFGSRELVEIAAEAGPSVGITFDTGNPLAVGEEVLAFARTAAPLVRHLHLKDYRAQWTDEGYRLVRCAIGEGCVPLAELAAVLAAHHSTLTASLEPGALEARHIRLFTPAWWDGYPARTARELGPCLSQARRNHLPDDADARTPWERGEAGPSLLDYEMGQIRRSAETVRALGWL